MPVSCFSGSEGSFPRDVTVPEASGWYSAEEVAENAKHEADRDAGIRAWSLKVSRHPIRGAGAGNRLIAVPLARRVNCKMFFIGDGPKRADLRLRDRPSDADDESSSSTSSSAFDGPNRNTVESHGAFRECGLKPRRWDCESTGSSENEDPIVAQEAFAHESAKQSAAAWKTDGLFQAVNSRVRQIKLEIEHCMQVLKEKEKEKERRKRGLQLTRCKRIGEEEDEEEEENGESEDSPVDTPEMGYDSDVAHHKRADSNGSTSTWASNTTVSTPMDMSVDLSAYAPKVGSDISRPDQECLPLSE